MVTIPPDPYNILGIDRKATAAEIRSAYRKLVLKCHPDKVEDPALKLIKQDEFQKVQEAYELLGEQEKRDRYDEKIRLQELRTQFAAASMQPNSSAPRTPPKYNYANVNVRTAEPPRAQSFPTATASTPKMYSHSAPKSSPWDEPRLPEEVPKTARRTASYDERSTSGKREDERRRRRDVDVEEEDETERERERERERDRERRAYDKEQRRAERAERAEKDEKRAKKDKKEKEKEKEEKRSKRADSDEKKSKSRSYADEDDEDAVYESEKKKSSSSRSLEKEAEKAEKEKKEKKREREREREREVPRERSVSAQREEASIEDKQNRNLEQAMKYIKTSQAKAVPSLSRASSYTAGVAYVTPPSAPMPPLEEEDVRRPSTRVRRGSQESRTKEKLSSKKAPSLEALVDEQPFVVDAVPTSVRHNLSRAHTATEREFTRPTAEIPIPAPPRRADTFHYATERDGVDARGRHRSRHHSQVLTSEDEDEEEEYRREPKNMSRRGSRARSPDFMPRTTTVYTVNDGRSHREGSYRASPERSFVKPTAYTYVQPPAMSSARTIDPRTNDPRAAREGYTAQSSKVRVAKSYAEKDVNFAPYRDGTWGSVPA